MNVSIIPSVDQAHEARWIAVVIDVFRAFSVECYIFNNGAKYIIPVWSLEEAYELKKKNPDYILIWERHGIRPEWFNYGNSPTELANEDFTDKIIVHTTSNGTKWLLNAIHADEIITWAFINAKAIIKYIKERKYDTVSLVSTAPLEYWRGNEDMLLAECLRDQLEWKTMDNKYIRNVVKQTNAYAYLFNEINVPQSDFDLCIDFDKFDFVIKQIIVDSRKVLARYDI